VIRDSIEQKYFQLSEQEYGLLRRLDGKKSLAQLARELEHQFAPSQVSAADLQECVTSFYQQGLLISDGPGQAESLLQRRAEQRFERRTQAMLNILAIRLPAINSDWFLEPIYGRLQWVFSRATAWASGILVLSAACLLAVHADTAWERLPQLQAMLSTCELPWWIIALAATKVWHELGHAVACRHFAKSCPPVGAMLLAFTPALYCDVSDAWLLPRRGARIAIAAGGMIAEVLLASVCVWLWWFSVPGLLNALCFKVLVICSLGTLLLNANPLLRYDGYFILSDFTGIANLAPTAARETKRRLARWCLGMELPGRATDNEHPLFLIGYCLASTIYRWSVIGIMVWGIWRLLDRLDLRLVGNTLLAVTATAMLIPGLRATKKFLERPAPRRPFAPLRVALTGILLLLLSGLCFFLPLPLRVHAPAVMELRDAQGVYVTSPGQLHAQVHSGDSVQPGDVLATLANPKLTLQIAELMTERDAWQARVASLQSQQLAGVGDGSQLPGAKAALADLEAQLKHLQNDASRLTLLAPRAGLIVSAASTSHENPIEGELSTWTHSPLDPRNEGSWLERGTVVCFVGDADSCEAVLHISQADIELVLTGQRVRLITALHPGTPLWGTIREISKQDAKAIPAELSDRELPTKTDENRNRRPLDTWYQARLELDPSPVKLLPGTRGDAQILASPSPLASQIARLVRQTFGF
jgi:putative peptide zinc metalloprotease protein